MKTYKIIVLLATILAAAACTSGNGNKADQKGPDTVRTDTSALRGTNDSASLHKDSVTNQNADPSGRVK